MQLTRRSFLVTGVVAITLPARSALFVRRDSGGSHDVMTGGFEIYVTA